MNTSTSWTGIPRDNREQERLRLEHQLFSNISFDNDAEDSDHRLGLEPYDDEDDEDEEHGSEFTLEYPRNPHIRSRDYSVPTGLYPADDVEEGETKSTIAHHASGITFRTGLRARKRDQSYDLSNVEYDPDRPLDALLRGTSNLSILKDSPRTNKEQSSSHSRSEFTKRADGLGRQIDDEKSRRYPTVYDLDEPARTTVPAPAAAFSQQSRTLAANLAPTRAFPSFSRVQLPDVTGITSAIATPLKGDTSFKRLSSSATKPGVQFRLPSSSSSRKDLFSQSTTKNTRGADRNNDALEDLTKRLGVIERENATSRRRVNELEMELEACKEEVAQEKTKFLELTRDGNLYERGTRSSKTLKTIHQGNTSLRESERRYREAVEEKKALEDLVASLRAHLTRMSEKVTNHHDIINTLRTTREHDAHELRLKCLEIDRLRSDVDTLQEDVVRLRDVVEDGLRERKRDEPSFIVIKPQVDLTANEEEEESMFDNSLLRQPAPVPRRAERQEVLSAVMEEEEPLSRSATTLRSAEQHPAPASASTNGNRFVQDAELERVRAEMEERRSMRSMNASLSRSIERSVVGSPPPQLQPQATFGKRAPRQAQVHNTPPRPLTPDSDSQRPSPRITSQRPTSTLAIAGEAQEKERKGRESPIPMPQIRGERLERLFHAAPAHNERTCGVCHRRKRTSKRHSSSHHRRRSSHHHREQQDEEGDEQERLLDGDIEECQFTNGDERFIADIARRRGIPPQTVLARVLRELEDDFTHYKSIYVELADEYKMMDAASDMSKRNLLANHLREVIDVLEQKGDQIAALYDLLHFEDKPLPSSSPKLTSTRR